MSNSLNQNFKTLSLLKFALPSMIMMVFMSLYTIIDGIFVSRLVGESALSAVNIVWLGYLYSHCNRCYVSNRWKCSGSKKNG